MSIGNDLSKRVDEAMLSLEEFPVVEGRAILKEVLDLMCLKALGISCVVDNSGKLIGIFTDGDFRRKLLKDQKPFSAFLLDDVIDHAIYQPITILNTMRLDDALMLMERRRIWDLPVVDGSNTLVGLLHMHSVIKILLRS